LSHTSTLWDTNLGSLTFSALWHLLKGFFIFIKEGFLEDLSYYEYKNINFIGGLKDIPLKNQKRKKVS